MKSKLFLLLFMIVFSSNYVQAQSSSACGSKDGWHSLQKANKSFIKNPKYIKQRKKTANGQNPAYVVLSCSDSRTPPELIFNQGLGRIFCPRVAGNTAGDQVVDSIAFAVATWDVTTIVVMGHESCGAVEGAVDRLRVNGGVVDPDNGIFNAVLIPIERAIIDAGINVFAPNAVELATKANVAYAANQLVLKSPIIASALASGQIIIVGSVYSLSSGKAHQLFVWSNCGIEP
ncbi:MAG: carbonic anhydrase [Parachlamydiaceae bacterium]|nr:carbonic anhydrase [Parachlamydiaceae bacterium]